MKIKIDKDTEDEFDPVDTEIAQRGDKIYRVFRSKQSYCYAGCLGRIKAVIGDDGEVLTLVYPLTSSSNGFSIIKTELLEMWRKIIQLYDQHTIN